MKDEVLSLLVKHSMLSWCVFTLQPSHLGLQLTLLEAEATDLSSEAPLEPLR